MPPEDKAPPDQLPLFGPTFSAIKLEFWKDLEQGKKLPCPCCARDAKIYTRKLNSGMARDLIRMFRMRPNGHLLHEWIEWRNLWSKAKGSGREFQRLRHWNLIEHHPEDNSLWKITTKGEHFVLGQIRVPQHVIEFATIPRGFTDDHTSIREAVGDHFDYDELMATNVEINP